MHGTEDRENGEPGLTALYPCSCGWGPSLLRLVHSSVTEGYPPGPRSPHQVWVKIKPDSKGQSALRYKIATQMEIVCSCSEPEGKIKKRNH